MRALLSTIGTRGDVQPLAALAAVLRDRGHEVRLCVPPDFVDWLASLGFESTPVGPRLRTLPAGPAPVDLSPERRRQLAEESVAAQFETIARAADGCDLIVGATALQIAAPSIAERLGVPYVFAAYCPEVLPSRATTPLLPTSRPEDAAHPPGNDELWRRDAARFNQLFGSTLNAQRGRLGLPPLDDVRSHVLTAQPWLAADPTLAPWPVGADASVVQAGAWIVRDTRPLSADLVAFLDAGHPPLYFGFGSMRSVPTPGSTLVHVARAVGRRAVIARGWAEFDVPPASDCIVVDDVNQQALFARVAVVVHHGGAGTTTCAAAAGVPQVIVPQMYDQPYWARRVVELGVGAALPKGAPVADTLITSIERVLDSEASQQAKALAPHVRLDGASVAAARLEAIVAR